MLVVADLAVGDNPGCHDSQNEQQDHNVEGHPIHSIRYLLQTYGFHPDFFGQIR
jgi:hypothetical protein